jgi:hypothetical protein
MSRTEKFDQCQKLAWLIEECKNPITKKALVSAWALAMQDFLKRTT